MFVTSLVFYILYPNYSISNQIQWISKRSIFHKLWFRFLKVGENLSFPRSKLANIKSWIVFKVWNFTKLKCESLEFWFLDKFKDWKFQFWWIFWLLNLCGFLFWEKFAIMPFQVGQNSKNCKSLIIKIVQSWSKRTVLDLGHCCNWLSLRQNPLPNLDLIFTS